MSVFTPDTIRNIGRYAGILPPQQIADRLGLSLSFVERVARQQGFDLRIPTRREDAEDDEPAPQAAGVRRHGPLPGPPFERLTVHLFTADLAEIMEAASPFRLTRNAAVRRIVENARARGLIEDLLRLPAPKRTADDR